jgi:predicted phage terminase large subunit-like protein
MLRYLEEQERREELAKNEPAKVEPPFKPYAEWLPEVSPTYTWHWKHTIYLVDKVQQFIDGKIEKLMIFMPPRHTKSETVTVRLPAYLLERWNHKRVIVGAYNQTLANKFSRKTRRIAAGRVAISTDRTAVDDWETIEGGGLRAVGVGGGITGMGGDVVIIDDPVKNREEANSETYRERCWTWYTDDLMTRLEPGGQVILIMTRWHEDDLAGRILASEEAEEWTVVNLPALAEKDDPLGRAEGEALCPERYDEAWLNRTHRRMRGSFQALYQQRPAAEDGEIFKREWWQYYREAPAFQWICITCDSAFKKGEDNDYSVFIVWGVTKTGYYILDVWRQKVEFHGLKTTANAIANKWNPRLLLIEDKASGQSLIQELKRDTPHPVIPIKVDSDKVSRANAASPTVQAGRVYLPENAPWLLDFIDELATFPNGAHDDQVDALTIFVNHVRKMTGQAFQDYREEAEANAGKGQHIWIQSGANPRHFGCNKCGITVVTKEGQTAQLAAEGHSMGKCTK